MKVNEVVYRSFALERDHIDEESRRAIVAFSSEEPVERSFGFEVLDHSESAIKLDFLNSGRAPLLLDHDARQQIGVVENVMLDTAGRKARAVVRFGKNSQANEIFSDVLDGIRGNISVGYRIEEMELETERKKDFPATYRVTKWQPLEVSIVSIPADTTVGVGRTIETKKETLVEEKKMETKVEVKEVPPIDVAAIETSAREKALQEYRKNVDEILELGKRHNKQDLANQAIRHGKSAAEFRGILLDEIGNKPLEVPGDKLDLSRKEIKEYRLSRALNAMITGDWRNAQFERECSEAIAKRIGRTPRGIFIPNELQKRDLTVGTDTAGGYTVATDLVGIIDLLRKRMIAESMGARVLTDLAGDVAIPKLTGGATAYWVNENAAITESNQTFGQVQMSPKTLGAMTDISRKLIAQSSLDIENLIREDLATVLAIELDDTALQGSGAASEPEGITNTTGIGAITWATSSTPTWGEVIDVESEVANDNALFGSLGYVAPSALVGTMKQTEKATNTGQFIWEGNMLNGYRAEVSNQCPAATLIFGNWNDLIIGYWTGMDVLVDPYTGSSTGAVRVRVMVEADIAIRHAESFSKGSN